MLLIDGLMDSYSSYSVIQTTTLTDTSLIRLSACMMIHLNYLKATH